MSSEEDRVDALARNAALGCGGLVLLVVLLIAGGAIYNSLTRPVMVRDTLAGVACRASADAEQAPPFSPAGFQAMIKAIRSAQGSSAEGLAAGVGPTPGTTGDEVERQLAFVSQWCRDNPL